MDRPASIPTNQFHQWDHSYSSWPHDFILVFLIFLPIALMLVWISGRVLTGLRPSLRAALSATLTLLLVYPIRMVFWFVDKDTKAEEASLTGHLFRSFDLTVLPILLIMLAACAWLAATMLQRKARLQNHAEEK